MYIRAECASVKWEQPVFTTDFIGSYKKLKINFLLLMAGEGGTEGHLVGKVPSLFTVEAKYNGMRSKMSSHLYTL